VSDESDESGQQARATHPADEYLEQRTETARYHLEGLTDWQLIGLTQEGAQYRAPMEMARRLKDSINDLRGEMVDFKTSSNRWAKRLFCLTVVLIVATVALVFLTWRLWARS
jgi:hypothetical protein